VKTASLEAGVGYRVKIGSGMVVLAGFGRNDQEGEIDVAGAVKKVVKMRIFDDGLGKMNLSVEDVGGQILLISQFTLFAETEKGNRPYFGRALEPELAKEKFNSLVDAFKAALPGRVESGLFGAYMQIKTVLDGPVTIILDYSVKSGGKKGKKVKKG
ncbi:MAG: D-tyrosyl-tRNA(Tyr) deacylase, partial [bacterium]|nr:D-tyrosyl-tRNA(Tyr) deacylase [bacterium]